MNDSLSEVCNQTDIQQVAPLGWIMAAQAWAWTVSCVGGVGNLVTICAIAYQLYLGRVWRRRHCTAGRPVVALEGDTILLLHLSICDFLYCAVNLPITAITYNYALGHTDLQPSKTFCTGAALFRYVNALAEWTTLGLLTVQRCVDLGRSRGARFFRPRPTIMFIAGIWVGSVVLQLGAIVGKMMMPMLSLWRMQLLPALMLLMLLTHLLILLLLLLLLVVLVLLLVVLLQMLLLQLLRPPELASQRFRSMMKSTVLLLMLLFLFLACVIPMCVYSVDSLFSERKIALGIAIFMIYWIQYGVNFIVYAASNENYRTAYKQYLMLLVNWVCCLGRGIHSKDENKISNSKADITNPKSLTALTVLQRGCSTTSLALLPVGKCRKGSGGSCISASAEHPHGSHPHLPSLHRLKSCNSEPLARSELDRRGHVLRSWSLWLSSSQSSRSSVLTIDSTVQHDSDANTSVTTNTTICPLSPATTLNTSSTMNRATTNTSSCPLSLTALNITSTASIDTTPTNTTNISGDTSILPNSKKNIKHSSTTTTAPSTKCSPTSTTSSNTRVNINITTCPLPPASNNTSSITVIATSATTSSTFTTSSAITISRPTRNTTDTLPQNTTTKSLTFTTAITERSLSTAPTTTVTTNTIIMGANATTAV